jgi:sugar/nucleoside kinase (ribokinase family)
MQTRPPPGAQVDQLVVGALAIDRLADGREAAGGTVVHATRALRLAGRSTAIATVAGDEPSARVALDELRAMAPVEVQPSPATTTFAIEEGEAGRRLTLLARSARLVAARLADARSILLGPLAGEVVPNLIGSDRSGRTGAVLQGWLRRLEPGQVVEPLSLGSLPAAIVARLRSLRLLVASVDDLAAEGSNPERLLEAMRRTFGETPVLAVTAGTDGAWIGTGGVRWHVPVPREVHGVSTVGAGDAFAALMLDALVGGAQPAPAAEAAAAGVAAYLDERLERARP